MKKTLGILLLMVFLTFINSNTALGNTWSILGDYSATYCNYSLQLEYSKYNPLVFYIDHYNNWDNDDSFSNTTLGVEYFSDLTENMGFYGGVGITVLKSGNSDSTTNYRAGLLEQNIFEYRIGYRFRPISEYSFVPWLDFGYSNLKMLYFNLGYSF